MQTGERSVRGAAGRQPDTSLLASFSTPATSMPLMLTAVTKATLPHAAHGKLKPVFVALSSNG